MNIPMLRQWYDVFKNNNQLTEIRILDNGRKTYSGYFTDIETLINAIKPYDNYNIYFTLNAINDSCYDREQRDKIIQKPKCTTSDNDIVGVDWILIDIDVDKPSDTNSTDEEKELAKGVANKVYAYLRDLGFSKPVVCDSSNGVHLNYRVAMLNNEENTKIRKDFLQVLDMLFSTDKVKIDTACYNAARICKCYGVMSRKGSGTSKNRPQRESAIIRVPNEIKITPNGYFQKVASFLPKEETPNRYNNYSNNKFNLDEFIAKYNIKIRNIQQTANCKKYILETCPFNPSHTAPDSALFVMNSGAIAFKCLHNSDSDKGWREFRSFFDPNAYDRKFNDFRFKPTYNRDTVITPQVETKEKGDMWIKLGSVTKPKLNPSDFIPTGITELDKKGLGLMRTHITILSGHKACVDSDTEYFNGYEWKKIAEYKDGDKVLQYNLDGTANLVYPQRYIKEKCDNLWLMKTHNGNINQCVSEDHRIIYLSSRKNICEKTMKDLIEQHNSSKNGFCGRFITTFDYQGKGIDLSDDEIRLMCAIICDGTFKHNYKNKKICRFNIKKNRKKERLESILKKAGIKYRKEQYNPKDLEFSNYLFEAPRAEKEFGEYWYDCNKKQLEIICEEVFYWDGDMNTKPFHYFSSNKKNADFIQFALSSIGIRSSICIDNRVGQKQTGKNGKVYERTSICYSVSKCDGRSNHSTLYNTITKNKIVKYETKDGYKYCFTVPSGMLVLRRDNSINITGNCGKTSLMNMIVLNAVNKGYKVGMWSGEMSEGEIKQWMYLQAAGKQYVTKRGQSEYYETSDAVDTKISEWLDPYFSLYSNAYSQDATQICLEIEKRFNEEKFDLIVADNLMVLDGNDINGDSNEKDKKKVLMLKELAKKLNVHIILVAHPNKSTGLLRDKYISGSGNITNIAQNVFLWHRVKYNENEYIRDFERDYEEFFGAGSFAKVSDYSNILEIAKFRAKGTLMGSTYGMYYEKESGRFLNDRYEHIVYGWQEQTAQQDLPQMNSFESNEFDIEQNNEDCPF